MDTFCAFGSAVTNGNCVQTIQGACEAPLCHKPGRSWRPNPASKLWGWKVGPDLHTVTVLLCEYFAWCPPALHAGRTHQGALIHPAWSLAHGVEASTAGEMEKAFTVGCRYTVDRLMQKKGE